jgi:hypothetical protein
VDKSFNAECGCLYRKRGFQFLLATSEPHNEKNLSVNLTNFWEKSPFCELLRKCNCATILALVDFIRLYLILHIDLLGEAEESWDGQGVFVGL